MTLADDKKLPLVSDIEPYLSDKTERFYASQGIPLRRGYLFHGPPGTGKTSFATAVAGNFKLDMYMISLTTPGMDDKMLSSLFDSLPTRCVVLLEDIDSAGICREDLKKIVKKKKKSGEKNKQEDKTACVTLSGLLNCIDGPCSKDGRIVIMTSNTPDSLDSALVRPGRIDMKVYFGDASTEVLMKMFKRIYTKTSQDTSSGDADRIQELAHRFASSIPSEQLSPAEALGYLMMYRNDPVTAADRADHWAADVIDTKLRGANVSLPKSEAVVEVGESGSDDGKEDDSDVDDDAKELSDSAIECP